MSSTADRPAPPPADLAAAGAEEEAVLPRLRQELDGIDDAIHDLLMRRAEVVTQVGAAKGGRPALRPGREAAILRRLVARHAGPLPPQALVRIWRELFAGTTAMQAPYAIAVCDPMAAGEATALAREHFGALTPMRTHRTPAQSIAEVSAGTATAAVLPLPSEDETQAAAWWTALLHKDAPRIHIVARLPFWSPRPEGAPRSQAVVVSAIAPDATASDRSLLGLEVATDISRARLAGMLTAAGLAPGPTLLRRDPHSPVAHVLADVAGFVAEGDARLAAITPVLRPPVVLGAYATMLEGDAR